MSPFLLVTTILGLAVPIGIGWLALRAAVLGFQAPVGSVALILVVIYAGIWFYGRPRGFVVGDGVLTIVWPVRQREILLANIVAARVVDRADFRERFGHTVRVGAGGLWGQFGMAYNPSGSVDTYISTMGPWVLLDIEGSRPLLISPEQPDAFVAALSQAAA